MWDMAVFKIAVILGTVICHRRIAGVDTTNGLSGKCKLRFPEFAEKVFYGPPQTVERFKVFATRDDVK